MTRVEIDDGPAWSWAVGAAVAVVLHATRAFSHGWGAFAVGLAVCLIIQWGYWRVADREPFREVESA